MTIKLTYFDFNGGRGEPARLAMYIGGIEFEDDRIAMEIWPERKMGTPLHQLPVLEIDGKVLTQSNSINRYIGRSAMLYPSDPWQAALCDETMDIMEDLTNIIVPTFFMEDENEKRAAREEMAKNVFPLYLGQLQNYLQERGNRYFADDRLTVADLKVFVMIRYFKSGLMDYVDVNLVDEVAPALVAHFERVNEHSQIKAYYDSH